MYINDFFKEFRARAYKFRCFSTDSYFIDYRDYNIYTNQSTFGLYSTILYSTVQYVYCTVQGYLVLTWTVAKYRSQLHKPVSFTCLQYEYSKNFVGELKSADFRAIYHFPLIPRSFSIFRVFRAFSARAEKSVPTHYWCLFVLRHVLRPRFGQLLQ